MSGYFNPESARLKRLRGLYRRDPNAALREIYNPRTRVARRMSEDDINEPRTSIPTDTERRPNLYQNVTESRQELTEEPLPQNIGDYNIFQFKRAIQNNPAPIKQYINAIPWGPAGNFKAFDDFMTGQATIGQCIGLNCYQNSFLNLMANQAKTRSRDASPTRVYGEERGNIKGFTPTEGNFETLFNRMYRYPEEKSDDEQEHSSSSSESSEGEASPQRLEEIRQRLSQGLQATSQKAAQRSSLLPKLNNLQNVPKNTIAYSYPQGVKGHTILADQTGTTNDAIWRSLQMRNAAPRNLDALNLANLEDIGPWNMIYTTRFK